MLLTREMKDNLFPVNKVLVGGWLKFSEESRMQTAPRIPSLVMSTPFSIAKSFVRLREVTDGMVGLDLGRKNIEYRGILTMNCVNFALMSENEQEGVIESFKGFLNGL